MKFLIDKKTSCTNCIECSNNIIEKLQNEFNCKLIAENESDTVHGSVSIYHEKNNHKITIEFYEKEEIRENLPTLKKLSKIPTESEIKKAL